MDLMYTYHWHSARTRELLEAMLETDKRASFWLGLAAAGEEPLQNHLALLRPFLDADVDLGQVAEQLVIENSRRTTWLTCKTSSQR